MNIKQIIAVGFAGMAMCGAAFAAGTVSDVKARQRYPWNGKVDIDCTLSGTAGTSYALTVNARDRVGCTNLAVKTVSVEGGSATGNPVSVTPGTYRLVWDAGADLPNGFRGEKISISVSVSESAAGKKFMIVDLSSGAITYQATAPEGGWDVDEYKLTKMAFQRVEPGAYWQKSSGLLGRNVTITKAFYLSVAPITCAQCYVLTGKEGTSIEGETLWRQGDKAACYFKGSSNFYSSWGGPCTFHRYVRGNDEWPSSGRQVSDDSVVGGLRKVTGRANFDLPTWGQLGLACKSMTLSVGGLGCLDYYTYDVGESDVVDPVGPRLDLSYKFEASYSSHAYKNRVIVDANGGDPGASASSQVRLCMFDVD